MQPFWFEDSTGKAFQTFALVGELSTFLESLADSEANLFALIFDYEGDGELAYKVYVQIRSRHEQKKAVLTAAKEVLPAESYDDFAADFDRLAKVYGKRNDIIHAFVAPIETGNSLDHNHGKANKLGAYKAKYQNISDDFIRQAIYEAVACKNILNHWELLLPHCHSVIQPYKWGLDHWRQEFDNSETRVVEILKEKMRNGAP